MPESPRLAEAMRPCSRSTSTMQQVADPLMRSRCTRRDAYCTTAAAAGGEEGRFVQQSHKSSCRKEWEQVADPLARSRCTRRDAYCATAAEQQVGCGGEVYCSVEADKKNCPVGERRLHAPPLHCACMCGVQLEVAHAVHAWTGATQLQQLGLSPAGSAR